MFARYVSFGNSITAGFQSGGINDSTQRESYAVLLARQLRSPFVVPSLRLPGCPPPIDTIFTMPEPGRVGMGTTAFTCALRVAPEPLRPFVSNVAVPGAHVLDVLDNLADESSPNPLTVLILGGLTQFGAARLARPTFATVWIGNNDALGAVLGGGDTTLLTPPDVFAARYGTMADSLRELRLDGGVLIGVVQVAFIPFLSEGRAYAAASQDPALGGRLSVLPSCLAFREIQAGDTARVSVPIDVGGPLLLRAIAGDTVTLDCAGDEMVSAEEIVTLRATVTAYNQVIDRTAALLGWPYLDPNVLLEELRAIPGALRPFPVLPPDPAAVTHPFGTAVSRDGIHPNAASHALVARALIDLINAHYQTAIPSLD